MSVPVSGVEVAAHNTRQSCWVIIHGYVYDVTGFLSEHPGGDESILKSAGKDATEEFDLIHPPGTLESALPTIRKLGPVEKTSTSTTVGADPTKHAAPGPETSLSLILCLDDFERAAKSMLSGRGWAYFSSASENQVSHCRNLEQWAKVSFRPRVLRDVRQVETRCTILGHASNSPFFIAPCALGRLGHPEGELCLVRAAIRRNIPCAVSTGSSFSPEQLAGCLNEERQKGYSGGCLFYQLYVKKNKSENLEIIRRVKSLDFRALLVTVDTPVVAKRELDDLYKAQEALKVSGTSELNNVPAPTVREPYMSWLTWDDLRWLRAEWGSQGPLCLKGITTADDANMAASLGFTTLYLSNHGGRQLDGAPAALETMLEIRKFYPHLLQQCEILLDGGVRRGTDIMKALAMGATSVGIGRPFMYALSTHQTAGVVRAIDILQHEILTNIRILGVTSLKQLNQSNVNTKRLDAEIADCIQEPRILRANAIDNKAKI